MRRDGRVNEEETAAAAFPPAREGGGMIRFKCLNTLKLHIWNTRSDPLTRVQDLLTTLRRGQKLSTHI